MYLMVGLTFAGGVWLFRDPVRLTSTMRDAFRRFLHCLNAYLDLTVADCRRQCAIWSKVSPDNDDPFTTVIRRNTLAPVEYGPPAPQALRFLPNPSSLFLE